MTSVSVANNCQFKKFLSELNSNRLKFKKCAIIEFKNYYVQFSNF